MSSGGHGEAVIDTAVATEARAALREVLDVLGTRLPAPHFLAIELPAALRPERLVGAPGGGVLVSYERPEAHSHLIGVGEARAETFGAGARPRDARAALHELLAAECEVLSGTTALNPAAPNSATRGTTAPASAAGAFTALRPRVFAGFAFDPDGSRTGPWRGFGSGVLRLPAVLFVREGERLGIVVAPGVEAQAVARACEALTTADQPPAPEPAAGTASRRTSSLRTVVDIPRAAMARSVERLATDVRSGVYEKVVLAGQREVGSDAPIDVARSVAALRRDYPDCHVFTITCAGSTFLGASPELLVRLSGGTVTSLGLAGSAPRGTDPESDRELGAALLDSAKNRIEHEIVVRALREALAPVTTELRAPNDPGLRKLRNIQHLSTDVSARVAPGVDVLTLLDRLHPTPAVCGWPTAAARGVIADHESFDRGWYAGPVGWIDAAGEGEFAVTLRSALVREERAWLFAGAGIMGDSQPEAELDEIDLKFRPLTNALAFPAD